MCIIAVKPQGVALPSVEILKRMYNKNPDGAGVAYAINGIITINKGYMNINEYIKAVQKIPINATAIIHTRISTSGGIDKELTHPYKLTNDYKELRQTHAKMADGYAVAHNGIFGEFGTMQGANDTMQFIVNYLHPLKELKDKTGGAVIDNDIKPIINKLVSGSRLVIMDVDGNYMLYGNYWHEQDGIYYSNEGYKQRLDYSTSYYSSKYNTYNKGGYKTLDDDYMDECDGYCDYCKNYYKCAWYKEYAKAQQQPAPKKIKNTDKK